MKKDVDDYKLNKFQIRSFNEYQEFKKSESESLSTHWREIEKKKSTSNIPFVVEGFSYTAKKTVNFQCDYKYSPGFPVVNWRERLVCPITALNNRTRAAIHLIDLIFNIKEDEEIYIMEQVTPLFRFLKNKYKNLIGSEYLGEATPLGLTSKNGIRNEDATCLTFASNSLDLILSFDVFEHVPDYKLAFAECFRVLKDGGHIFFSVPFALLSEDNIIRATVDNANIVTHILPPIFHGDPMNSQEGVLCFQEFGWALLDDLLEIGFTDAYALIYWSSDFGYFGSQIQFIASKNLSKKILSLES
ncbi:AdoMet_MTases domain containing protein [Burkholderiaceae bacterium]